MTIDAGIALGFPVLARIPATCTTGLSRADRRISLPGHGPTCPRKTDPLEPSLAFIDSLCQLFLVRIKLVREARTWRYGQAKRRR